MKTAMLGKVIKPEKKTQKEYYMIREGFKLSLSYSVLKCCGVLSLAPAMQRRRQADFSVKS